MARPPNTQPTDAELEILKVLWEHGPAGLGQIHAAIQERRQVALTTIATTLKTMLGKSLVKAATTGPAVMSGRPQPRVGPPRRTWSASSSSTFSTDRLDA